MTTLRAGRAAAPTLLEHEWHDAGLHEQVVRQVFKDVPQFDLTLAQWSDDMAHYREVVLSWASGPRLTVRIDQGFGLVGPARGPFPFASPIADQAALIRSPGWSCARTCLVPSAIYVRWEGEDAIR